MTAAERLIPYVIQGIQDEGGTPSRTRVLKIIYLIDVEHFRRYRHTLTGWRWLFYHFGPYAFEYPRILESLSISLLDETEGLTDSGKQFYTYSVATTQQLHDIVKYSDQVAIDETISRWSLEDLNLLLNHVYFRTDPMTDAVPGEPLDFTRIPREQPTRRIDPEDVVISAEDRERFRQRLAEARRRLEERGDSVAPSVRLRRVEADELYLDSMERRDREESKPIPGGLSVQME